MLRQLLDVLCSHWNADAQLLAGKRDEIIRAKGLCKVIALRVVTAQPLQLIQLYLVLDASAMTCMPREWASAMIAWTMDVPMQSEPMSLTNERSIFNASIGIRWR